MSLELGRILNVELDTVVAAQLIRIVQACDDCLTNNCIYYLPLFVHEFLYSFFKKNKVC